MTSETVVVELEREEVEALRGALDYVLADDYFLASQWRTAHKSALPKLHAALASDSQGRGHRPDCDGSGRIPVGDPAMKESTPCPGCARCQPEQGGDGDWPELWAIRSRGSNARINLYGGDPLGQIPEHLEIQCYVPAPTQPSLSASDRERLERIAEEVLHEYLARRRGRQPPIVRWAPGRRRHER